MKQALIIYPVFAVVLLTFIIGIWMLRLRKARGQGKHGVKKHGVRSFIVTEQKTLNLFNACARLDRSQLCRYSVQFQV